MMVDNGCCAAEGAAQGGRKQMEGKDLSWGFGFDDSFGFWRS